MSTTFQQSITLQNPGAIPTGLPVTMSPDGIKYDGEDLPFSSLMQLPVVLGGLGIPDNDYTLKVRDTVYIEEKILQPGQIPNTVTIGSYNHTMVNGSSGNTIELNNDSLQQWIKVADGSGAGFSQLESRSLSLHANTASCDINMTNSEAPDKSIQLSCSIGQTTVTLNDGVTSYCQLWPDKLKISDGYTTDGLTEIGLKTISQNNIATNESITISTEGDATISLAKGGVGAARLKGEGTCLRLDSFANGDLKLNSNTGKTYIGDTDGLGHNTQIMIDDVLSVTSFRSGMMNRTIEIFPGSPDIPPYATFVTSNGFDCLLRQPSEYLNPYTQWGDGWYCYVFNCSGNDIALQNVGDYKMFSHAQGGPSSFATIKKYATVRITLVYAESYQNDFVWSVSMF